MKVLMQCVGEAIVANGVKGLAELVPGGGFIYAVAGDAVKKYRERRKDDRAAEELRQMAAASFEEAKAVAEKIAREVASGAAPEERKAVELYLAQIPGCVRRSLRRAEDPSGKTVPPGLTLNKAEDLLARLPAQMPRFRPGDRVPGAGGWTLREPLGTGGFGEVWLAGHDVVPDLRAVKFCTDPESRHRLLTHEGKLVARVMREGRHPNVVGLVDAHLEGDAPWLAYEFVGGGDLAGIGLAWQKMAPEERFKQVGRALKQLAGAAGHFHRLSPPLVHRDLKPANILFDRQTKKLRITDFGIGGLAAAKQMNAETVAKKGTTQRTVSMLAGAFTPLYASPQQQSGGAPDPRDDVHALGVIAFQLLTGRFDQAPGPRYERDLKAAGVPEDFVRLIGDCVDPDASQRPADGAEVAGRLTDAFAPAVAIVAAEPAPPLVPPPVTRRPPPPPPEPEYAAAALEPSFAFEEGGSDRDEAEPRRGPPWAVIGGGIGVLLLVLVVGVFVLKGIGTGSGPQNRFEGPGTKDLAISPPPRDVPKVIDNPRPPQKVLASAEVAQVLREIDLPPLRPGDPASVDPKSPALGVPASLEDSVTPDQVSANPANYPFRAAVMKALATIRTTWAGEVARPERIVAVARGIAASDKKRLVDVQKTLARASATLEDARTALAKAGDKRGGEPKRWQAHYDYALAQLKLRIAYLEEYQAALGRARTDSFPALGGSQSGWTLVSAEKMGSSKDFVKLALSANGELESLHGRHPGTPWAASANNYRSVRLGLQWEPF